MPTLWRECSGADPSKSGTQNPIITAHTSGSTPKYGERALKLFGDNIEKVLRGEQPDNVVDLSAGY